MVGAEEEEVEVEEMYLLLRCRLKLSHLGLDMESAGLTLGKFPLPPTGHHLTLRQSLIQSTEYERSNVTVIPSVCSQMSLSYLLSTCDWEQRLNLTSSDGDMQNSKTTFQYS